MALKINIPEPSLLKPKISIFGVGGAGGNALNNMIRSNLEGVEFIAANTDAQSLSNSLAANRIQLGLNTTKGLGAGSFPDRGRAAAEENIDEIVKLLEGNNMVFITAGMGGGTGTGAAPVIAKLARERDILTVGVVTKPFQFEGKYRMEAAELGIEELKKCVDTLIIIPNQNLFRVANEQTTFESAFKMADNVLHAGVRGVTDLITMPGLVNLDFADIRTIMTKMGKALMGTGEASGENRAVIACEEAISNPLLDDISIRGAKGVLVNMTGGPDMTLFEADLAVNTIKREVDPNANIIFGSAFNEDMKGKIRISIVATGIDENDFYNSNKDDSTKSKSQMVYEIKSYNKTSQEDVVNAAMQGKKTFFDPGTITEPQQSFSQIPVESFEERLNEALHAEENDALIAKEEENNRNETEDKYKPIISFEDKDVFDHVAHKIHKLEERLESNSKSEKSSAAQMAFHKKIEQKKEAGKKEASKKESGFSLFGFMNGGGSKNVEVSTKKDAELQNKLNKRQTVIIEDDEEVVMNKVPERAYKKQPSATEEKEEMPLSRSQDRSDFANSDEDDMLNVPAFFRRKK